MLLDAADQALAESGYLDKPFDRRRAAVVVGTVFGGDFCTQLNLGLRRPELARYLKDTMLAIGIARFGRPARSRARGVVRASIAALHDETGSFTSSTLASRLSKTFDFMGGAMAIDSGSASSWPPSPQPTIFCSPVAPTSCFAPRRSKRWICPAMKSFRSWAS